MSPVNSLRVYTRLTWGDALGVLFLLAFICTWTGGWFWALEVKKYGDGDSSIWFYLLLVLIPDTWAGGLISRIVFVDD